MGFAYHDTTHVTAPGLVASVTTPTGTSTLSYDVRGNLSGSTTPLGLASYVDRDAIGRDTLSRPAGGPNVRTRYNAAGLVESTEQFWGGQSLTVSQTYDRAGRVLSTTRLMAPDTNQIGRMMIESRYDVFGRKIRETASGRTQTWEYSKAGQVVRHTSRRGLTTTMRYDAVGRLEERITPEVRHEARKEISYLHEWLFPAHPLDPDTPTDSLLIPGDTARFTYDEMGRLRAATNRDARVFRRYDLAGRLIADTLKIRTYAGRNFDAHVYGIEHRYDRSGRRRVTKHPRQLAPVGRDSVIYAYDPAIGALSSVTDLMGNLFGFRYDDEGQLVQQDIPGQITERMTYDADGRLRTRVLSSGHPSSGLANNPIYQDTLSYTERGQIRRVTGMFPGEMQYAGLGAMSFYLAAPSLYRHGSERQTLEPDPLGNVSRERTEAASADVEHKQRSVNLMEYVSGTGALRERTAVDPSTGEPTIDPYTGDPENREWWRYDASGNEYLFSASNLYGSNLSGSITIQERRYSYFGADDKLRVVDRQRCMTQIYNEQNNTGNWSVAMCGPWNDSYQSLDPSAFEEYRYDALGRRVLVRRRLYLINGNCTTQVCNSGIERIVWDGDQIAWEIRAPGDGTTYLESDNAAGAYEGRVGYTHGPGIDAPLSVLRIGLTSSPMVAIPHATWRGTYGVATFADGTTTFGGFNAADIPLPAHDQNAYLESGTYKTRPSNWFGSLLTGMKDASGHMYRRNRYYDPGSGRFTQEDPIGLAGGLNLYGFGGGDPVNYSDPFGLCKKPKGQRNGEVGICVEAFIRAKLGGAGNGRGPSSEGGGFKTSIRFSINPKTGELGSEREFSLGKTFGIIPGTGAFAIGVPQSDGNGGWTITLAYSPQMRSAGDREKKPMSHPLRP